MAKISETSDALRDSLITIFVASDCGSVDLLDEGLEKFEHVKRYRFDDIDSYTDDEGLTALMRAAKHGKDKTVRRLLEEGASGYSEDKRNRTALIWGVLSGNSEVVRLLVRHSDVEACDAAGNDPLFYALEGGNAKIVRLLLEAGVSTGDARYGAGGVVAHAIRKSTREVVECLIDAGEKLNGDDGKCGDALFEAIMKGDEVIVAKLLEKGANPNLPPLTGMSPVQTAMLLDEPEIIRLLLRAGACDKVSLPNGVMLRDWAMQRGYDGILAEIHEDSESKEKLAAALLKAAEEGSAELMELLVQAGGDIEKRDTEGKTALLVAADHGNLLVIKLLIQRGANVNKTDYKGQTALHLAIINDRRDIVEVLLESNVDVNNNSYGGITPLMVAAAKGEVEVLRLLIEKGADLNAGVDESALSWAVMGGKTESVRILLSAGAKLNSKCKGLLMKAVVYKVPLELVQLLIKSGLFVDKREFELAKKLADPKVKEYLESAPRYGTP